MKRPVKYSLTGLVLLMAICIQSTSGLAQDEILNQKKYWYYKARLNNNFVKIGTGAGESMPFNQRGWHATDFTNRHVQMKIGDGSSTLGHYIALLATEYFLLKNNGQDLTKTKRELFCALNAVNRLDYKGEIPFSGSPNLNGFFIRDDVPANFIRNNYKHFNYYSAWNMSTLDGNGEPNTINSDHGFQSLMQKGVFTENSDWTEAFSSSGNGEVLEMSQDQAYNILLGLAMVHKFVDYGATNNNATFPYESTPIQSIRTEAEKIAVRLITYIKDHDNWKIENSVTGNDVHAGHNAQLYAYAIAEAGCFINGQGDAPSFEVSNFFQPPKICDDFHNTFSKNKITAFTPWNTGANSLTTPPFNAAKIDNSTFYVNLAAICNCVYNQQSGWIQTFVQQIVQNIPVFNILGFIINWITALVNVISTVVHPAGYVNTTDAAIQNVSYFYDFDYAPLARKVLHPNVGQYLENPDHSYTYLLDVAPCEGTYNLGNNQWGHYQWSSDNRCDHPDRIGDNGGSGGSWGGEFNGIDYMLYYNLWRVHKYQQNGDAGMVDLDSVIVNKNGNALSNNVGNGPVPVSSSASNPIKINAFEYVDIKNTKILANQYVTIRAGKAVHFGPGVSISNPGTVHIDYPHPFSCSGGSVYQRTSGTDSIPMNDDDYSTMGYDRYHYLDYTTELEGNNPSGLDKLEYTIPENYSAQKRDLQDLKPGEITGFPTPAKDLFTISYNLEEGDYANIYMTDVMGTTILEKRINTANSRSIDIDLSTRPVGVYIVKLVTEKGIEKTMKVVKH